MIEREKLLVELESLSEEKFRIFNEKIVHKSKYRVIGVRMPDLKAIAKKHRADYKEIFELPDDRQLGRVRLLLLLHQGEKE